MSTEIVAFDRDAYSVDAVQRAAYRFADRASCEVKVGDEEIEAVVSPLKDGTDMASLVGEFRNEALDQVLRERIRAETADVRNLVLALAFSRTGLAEANE
jgi:His-Xaa-Ser system protein HxsD